MTSEFEDEGCGCDCCEGCDCAERRDCSCDFVACTTADGSLVFVRPDYIVTIGAVPIDFDGEVYAYDATMGTEAVEFAMFDVDAETFEWELSSAVQRGEVRAMAGAYAVEGIVDYFVEDCADAVDTYLGYMPTTLPECTVDLVATFAPWHPTVETS